MFYFPNSRCWFAMSSVSGLLVWQLEVFRSDGDRCGWFFLSPLGGSKDLLVASVVVVDHLTYGDIFQCPVGFSIVLKLVMRCWNSYFHFLCSNGLLCKMKFPEGK